MITVNQLRSYLSEKIVQIHELKTAHLIIDDSELSKFLKELKENQSPVLIGVMPAYPIEGTEDVAQWNNKLMFMIMHKVAYRDTDHEAFLDIFEQTQDIVRKFVYQMLEEKQNAEGLFCNQMAWVEESSTNIYPIWKKQGCNGWGIEIDVLTSL